MRFVVIGVFAVILSAGCALQPGDAGDESSPPNDLRATAPDGVSTPTSRTPMFRVGDAPQGAASGSPARPQNPDPAPWFGPAAPPRGGGNGGSNSNPDPAPWDPTAKQGLVGDLLPTANGTDPGSGGKSTNAKAPDGTAKVGHWDLIQE